MGSRAALLLIVSVVAVLGGSVGPGAGAAASLLVPDVAVTMSDSADPTIVGNTLTYTVTVTNNGPEEVDDPPFAWALTHPGSAPVITATVSPPGSGSCGPTFDPVHFSCALSVMTSGATRTITFSFTPSTVGTYTAMATVNLPDDPVQSNNSDTESTSATLPSVSIGDATVTEGNSGTTNATFTVTRSGTNPSTVRVSYATANDSAVAPDDYAATSGDLSFSPNETQKTVTVPVVGETTVEPNERFFVNLSNPGAATIGDGQGTGTITNDDGQPPPVPTLLIGDVSVTEGNAGTTNATFTVTKSGQTAATVGASYATANQTAVAPGDYQATNGALSFAPNETQKTLTVPVAGDTDDEANETFAVNLSAPTNATIADGQGIGTIVDDDAASELVEIVDNPASEPPPLIPQTRAISVNVRGGGTVVGLRRRGTQGAGQGVEQIRCGLQGLTCQESADVSQQVSVGARSGAGYRFDHWEGACVGDNLTCTVTASQARTIEAVFVPTNPGPASLRFRVKKPTIKAKWKQSVGNGSLLVRGSVASRALIRLRLHRPGGGPLLNRKKRVGPGAFKFAAKLKRGKLLRRATLLPGGFVVALRGQSGPTGLPLQVRTVSLASPGEGVVRDSYASSSRNGARLRQLPAGSTQAWATFRFSAQPKRSPIVVRWRYPDGRLVGDAQKNNRPMIKSGIGGSAIPSGTWRADLLAGGRLVKRLNVVVG